MENALLIMGLAKLAMLAFTLGLIFFVVWAIKNLKKDKLFTLSIVLMVVGVLVCLLTVGLGKSSYKFKNHNNFGYGKMKSGMTWETCQKKVESLKDAKAKTTKSDTTK